jgi:hypothetical protein
VENLLRLDVSKVHFPFKRSKFAASIEAIAVLLQALILYNTYFYRLKTLDICFLAGKKQDSGQTGYLINRQHASKASFNKGFYIQPP